MFFNLAPYVTWLGIMLTSKPHDLQSRLNAINRPQVSPAITTTTTTAKPNGPTWDLFICSGRPNGRYAHATDCSKYFECIDGSEIVRPLKCPNNLHFSPTARVCTLPRDAGCRVPSSTPVPGISSNATTSTPSPPTSASSWVRQLESSNYFRAVNEPQLVIYYDHDIPNPASLIWPIVFTRTMWHSIQMMYGNFGQDNRLYLFLRGKRQASDLNSSSYLENTKGYVNGIEVGSDNWALEDSTNTDLITVNIAHIVSSASWEVRYPGPEPGWANIFVYDLYERVGRPQDMNRWETEVNATESSNIVAIPIFSQWYLHLYRSYGNGSILNRFIITRKNHFPRASNDTTLFARSMNRGEFVHFWSGACGRNLTALATSVFGWSNTLGEQYHKAIMDFNGLAY